MSVFCLQPTKKHVHFAAEDQFYEVDDVLITDHTELKYEPTSNGAEETVENSSSDNNSNNHNHPQQHNGKLRLLYEVEICFVFLFIS